MIKLTRFYLVGFIFAAFLFSGCSGMTPKPDTVSQNSQGNKAKEEIVAMDGYGFSGDYPNYD